MIQPKVASTLMLCVSLYAGLTGCRSMPQATPREREIRDEWAALIPPATRDRVITEAERHTEWGERRKVRYEVDRFQHLYNEQQKKSRRVDPASRPASAPTTLP
jgi:hypothetical protein